ncbi:GPI-anchored wall transfer protein 1-like [Aricia agestis]|uniref:GPI-anchored wall transfer protein 1-like n=1 Tax=Aricia agestis TaxID=91739 RepID=UPI001C207F12|nr:GPI-anchored wall transfer protein 1-like [Aricia agestis]
MPQNTKSFMNLSCKTIMARLQCTHFCAYFLRLMDTGVGLFVLMSGLVHKNSYDNYLEIFKHNFKFVSILLILGIIRYVSIKQLDYHEHVSEYGVHWNFFFTLALCKFFSTLLLLVFQNSLYLCIFVIIIHEYLLYIGLQDWVFSDTKRINIIDANREGISSCLGYISLYLFAVHLKTEINKKEISKLLILRKILLYPIFLIGGSYLFHFFRPTSRTLANAGYCFYLSTLLTSILSIMYCIEIISSNSKSAIFQVPKILKDINHNGLIYFLISNLTTGLVNMLFQTLLMSSLSTFIILNVYMTFNIVVISYLRRKKIKL